MKNLKGEVKKKDLLKMKKEILKEDRKIDDKRYEKKHKRKK